MKSIYYVVKIKEIIPYSHIPLPFNNGQLVLGDNPSLGIIENRNDLTGFIKEYYNRLVPKNNESFGNIEIIDNTLYCDGFGSIVFELESVPLYRPGVSVDMPWSTDDLEDFKVLIKNLNHNFKYSHVEINNEYDGCIIFDTGLDFQIGITDNHSYDCCECNFLDYSNVDDSLISMIDTNVIEIEPVPDYGFRINGEGIAGYSSQNGYYSSTVGIEIFKRYPDGSRDVIFQTPEVAVEII